MFRKLVIAGGSGFIGNCVSKHFSNKGWEVVVLSRQRKNVNENCRNTYWNGRELDDWCEELEEATAVLNLSGKSVDCRYTDSNKQEILNSRIESTKAIGEAIRNCKRPPLMWLNSSSATIYDHSYFVPNGEDGIIGDDFSMNICKEWEETFFSYDALNIKQVALRMTIVLGKDGGAYKGLSRLTKLLLGGKHGNGAQMFSWIHESDLCNAIEHILESKFSGIYNLAAPSPICNRTFMEAMRKVLGVKYWVNQPRWLLELGAFFVRTETELLLKSRFVIPKRLMNEGFQFEYKNINECLRSFNA